MYKLFFVPLLLVSVNAQATETINVKEGLLSCLKTVDRWPRVKCYDVIAKYVRDNPAAIISPVKQESAPLTKVVKKEDKGNWIITTNKSAIDDSDNVTIRLYANTAVKSSYKTVIPTLYIRCSENKTNVFIDWRMFLGSGYVDMISRLDKEKARSKQWNISTDHEAVFFSGSDIAYAKKLLKHEKLLVRITPYGKNTKTTGFDLAGIKSVIKPLRKACNW